jgi:hypothetical protein
MMCGRGSAASIDDDAVAWKGGKRRRAIAAVARSTTAPTKRLGKSTESVSYLSSVGLDATMDGESSWLHW